MENTPRIPVAPHVGLPYEVHGNTGRVPIRAFPVHFEGGPGTEVEFHGYWVHPTSDLKVQVPVFEHGFYPKLSHTEEEIRRNIQMRAVTIPSLASLRQSGYNFERAAFLSEINVDTKFQTNLDKWF